MRHTLDYIAADDKPVARLRWLNVAVIPATVAIVTAFALQGPAIAMRWDFPRRLGNALYFLPQTCFPYGGLVWETDFGSVGVFADATVRLLNALQWIVVAAALTWFTKRMKLRFAVPIAVAASLAIAIEGAWVFELFGASLELNGP